MIRISQLKLPVEHTEQQLLKKISKILRINEKENALISYQIIRRSLDAREKPTLYYQYVLDCLVREEKKIWKRADKKYASLAEREPYVFPETGDEPLSQRPVIIGCGPAGLFCGLFLARAGFKPIILERGKDVDSRKKDVEEFWKTKSLNPESNVQFGEGGAGTFSDGKLNTLVKDPIGRNRQVLAEFVNAGADSEILYDFKPHIGTDVLRMVVKNIRQEIIRLGGEVFFNHKVTSFQIRDKQLIGLKVENNGTVRAISCSVAVLAIGHSARDTFFTLYDQGADMQAKSFAVGFRVEHLQSKINRSQYGKEDPAPLSAAPYKLTAKANDGRGVYSFCMCPGGYVVNSSSEDGHLAVNGMSYSKRDGDNANSAIIVSVTPEDFPDDSPLGGVLFQRQLERNAYLAGNGKIPMQRLGDLHNSFYAETPEKWMNISENEMSPLQPQHKGISTFTDISGVLPRRLTKAFLEGMEQFDKKIHGYGDADTIVSAVESRTSSPVRINRDETLQSNLRGLYPCGEGAGYAGGITSAAMDGLKVAETIAQKYRLADNAR